MKKPLHFQIDPRSGIPIYRQLMDQIKFYIASDSLTAGDQLPSIRELSQTLTVNPTTIVKAFNELAHEQVIELRHGKGAFVMNGVSDANSAERGEALRKCVQRLVVEAGQLGAGLEETLEAVELEWAFTRGVRSGKEQQLRVELDHKTSNDFSTKRKSVAS